MPFLMSLPNLTGALFIADLEERGSTSVSASSLRSSNSIKFADLYKEKEGGHFMVFFGQKKVAQLYHLVMALQHLDGPLASLSTTGKLWNSKRLLPYLIGQLRDIFIAQRFVPTDLD
jgi:hypothetical protein